MQREKAREPITEVQPGDTLYVDLRAFGVEWYRQMDVPDEDHRLRVVEAKCAAGTGRKAGKLSVCTPVLNEHLYWSNLDVHLWAEHKDFDPDRMILVDSDFIKKYPTLLE